MSTFTAWSFHGGSSPYQGIAKYLYHTGCRPVSYDQYIRHEKLRCSKSGVTKSRPKQSNHGHVWYQVPGTRYVIEGPFPLLPTKCWYKREFFPFHSYQQNVDTKDSQTKWKWESNLAYWYHVSVSQSTCYHGMHASVWFSYLIVGIRLCLLHYPRTWYVPVHRSLGGIFQIWVSTSLYQDLGNLLSIKMFDAVFGFMERTETLRSWLWKDNIYKWISILAKSTTPEGMHNENCSFEKAIFVCHAYSKTRRQDLIKSKHLKKF